MGKRQRYVKSKRTFCNTNGIVAYYTKCSVFSKEPELSKLLDLLNITELDAYYIKRNSFKPYRNGTYIIELTKDQPSEWRFFKDPADYSSIIDSRVTNAVIVVTENGFVILRTKTCFRVKTSGIIDVCSLSGDKLHTVKINKNLVVNESF